MSRRHAAQKRLIKPDVKYKSTMLAKFINKVMFDGKKSLAQAIVYDSLDLVEKKYSSNGFECFNAAIENIRPELNLRSVRIGGSNYQVPEPVELERSQVIAMNWLLTSSRGRSEKSMVEKLCGEIFDAFNKRGAAIKKSEDNRKMAEANRAFAHYSPKKTQVD